MKQYTNEFNISGTIDYKIQNYTTKDKGSPYIVFLLKQERLMGNKEEPKTYYSRFPIKSFNKDLVDKMIVIKKKVEVEVKGRIQINTKKDKATGAWSSEVQLLADEINVTDYLDEPFEEKGSSTKKESEIPQKDKVYQTPASKDIDVILEQFEKDKKKPNLSKEIDDDDLPF